MQSQENLETVKICQVSCLLFSAYDFLLAQKSLKSAVGQWRKFSFLSGAHQFSESGEMLRLRYFAGRPDVYGVIKCANGIGLSDFTTFCIQKKLIEKDKNIP